MHQPSLKILLFSISPLLPSTPPTPSSLSFPFSFFAYLRHSFRSPLHSRKVATRVSKKIAKNSKKSPLKYRISEDVKSKKRTLDIQNDDVDRLTVWLESPTHQRPLWGGFANPTSDRYKKNVCKSSDLGPFLQFCVLFGLAWFVVSPGHDSFFSVWFVLLHPHSNNGF